MATGSSQYVCGICQDSISDFGKPSGCQHTFCVECILEWANVETTCPYCRVDFDSISRIRWLSNGALEISETTAVQKRCQVYNPETSEDSSTAAGLWTAGAYACIICGRDDAEDVLLLCDGCDCFCHTHCCGLDTVPEGDWFCSFCQSTEEGAAGSSGGGDRRATRGEMRPPAAARPRRAGRSALEAARRAQRRAQRNAARGRRSARARQHDAPITSAAAAAGRAPQLARNPGSLADMRSDLSTLRAHWGTFRARGFELRAGAPARQAAPELPEQTDSTARSWELAQEALAALSASKASGREGKRPETPRSSAIQGVRRLIQQRRLLAGGREPREPRTTSAAGLGPREGRPHVPLPRRLPPSPSAAPPMTPLGLAGASGRWPMETPRVRVCGSAEPPALGEPGMGAPVAATIAGRGSQGEGTQHQEMYSTPSPVKRREPAASAVPSRWALEPASGMEPSAAAGSPRDPMRKRPACETPRQAPAGSASEEEERERAKRAKHEAYQCVREKLKPLYASGAITRERYKEVAQAATRLLARGARRAGGGIDAAGGALFCSEAVQQAVDLCLGPGSGAAG
uniref:PHD and RING finger domain-containing protein 1 n=1 Tax=Tetraselmis sp. GSL018 TaxID=582737 RepID=A0A061SGG4_9CHLO